MRANPNSDYVRCTMDNHGRKAGHLADGSGVQSASAGDLYPFMIVAKQVGASVRWFVTSPSGQDGSRTFESSADAERHALEGVLPVYKSGGLIAADAFLRGAV